MVLLASAETNDEEDQSQDMDHDFDAVVKNAEERMVSCASFLA
jgi:hypothetical protein